MENYSSSLLKVVEDFKFVWHKYGRISDKFDFWNALMFWGSSMSTQPTQPRNDCRN